MKAPTLVTKARQQVNRGKTKNRDLMRIKLFLFLGKRHVNTLPLGSSLKSDGKCAHETVQRIDVSVMTERKSETQSKGVCVSASQQWAISRDPGGVAGRTPPAGGAGPRTGAPAGRQVGEGTAPATRRVSKVERQIKQLEEARGGREPRVRARRKGLQRLTGQRRTAVAGLERAGRGRPGIKEAKPWRMQGQTFEARDRARSEPRTEGCSATPDTPGLGGHGTGRTG